MILNQLYKNKTITNIIYMTLKICFYPLIITHKKIICTKVRSNYIKLTKNISHNSSALIKNLKTFLQMTLKRYNLYMTQHQKHFQRALKMLLTLHMNIILCECEIIKKHYFIFYLTKCH